MRQDVIDREVEKIFNLFVGATGLQRITYMWSETDNFVSDRFELSKNEWIQSAEFQGFADGYFGRENLACQTDKLIFIKTPGKDPVRGYYKYQTELNCTRRAYDKHFRIGQKTKESTN